MTPEQEQCRRMLAEVRPKLEGHGPHDLGLLMAHHGTDKFYLHHFEHEYQRHFAPLRDMPVRLLEIGVGGYDREGQGGDSLKVWRDYFREGEIFGLDIHDKSHCDDDRITTIHGLQNDVELLVWNSFCYGPFDIVIDDGSHKQSDILTSFRTLFPLLVPGGIYVIEDLATAYDRKYGGTITPFQGGQKPNTLLMLEALIDGLHYDVWPEPRPYTADIPKLVKSVHVSKDLAFIYKSLQTGESDE